MAGDPLKKGRYTNYSNKIGLFSNKTGNFISNSPEVVLNFPFKDKLVSYFDSLLFDTRSRVVRRWQPYSWANSYVDFPALYLDIISKTSLFDKCFCCCFISVLI